MKYLVTGGAGFIGSHVVEALLARGDEVVCVDNFNDYYDPRMKERNVAGFADTVYRDDITDEVRMSEIFALEQPDVVIHLAARAGVRPSIQQPLLYEAVNVRGTLVLLELARKYQVKKFVFASSSSVYGDREDVPFRESDPVDDPISPYAATKKAGELLCYTYHHLYGLSIACLRFFTVYGPRGRPDMAPDKFLRAVMAGKTIELFGDGTSLRDYTYIGDIVAGILASADTPLGYEVFNLGGGRPVRLNEFIHIVEETVGKKAHLVHKPMQPGDVFQTYADSSKAQRMLGWKAKVTFAEGIRKTYDWMRQ